MTLPICWKVLKRTRRLAALQLLPRISPLLTPCYFRLLFLRQMCPWKPLTCHVRCLSLPAYRFLLTVRQFAWACWCDHSLPCPEGEHIIDQTLAELCVPLPLRRNCSFLGTKFGEEGATQVGNLIKLCDTLRVLHISSMRFLRTIECFSAFSSHLDNQFNAGGAEHIGNGLKVNTSIEELRIDSMALIVCLMRFGLSLCWGNNIGDVGAKHIAWSMKVNTTITNLDLSCMSCQLSLWSRCHF